jgi:hypothetical protein
MPTSNFAKVVQMFSSQSAIPLQHAGCEGTCRGELIGPGFDVNCTSGVVPYNLIAEAGNDYQVDYVTTSFVGTGVPGTSSGNIAIRTAYKGSPAQIGNLITTNCSLQIAKIRYPFEVTNTTTILLHSTDRNDSVELQYPGPETAGLGVFPSRLGGIALAIQTLYNSNITLYDSGVFAIKSTGPMAATYFNSSNSTLGTSEMTWSDPTPDVLSAIREITFRAVVSRSGSWTFSRLMVQRRLQEHLLFRTIGF